MKKITVIIIMLFLQYPVFGYKIIHRQAPIYYNSPNNFWNNHWNYNYPNYNNYNPSYSYGNLNPITRIKRYFIGSPTGYTITPAYNTNYNNQIQRNLYRNTPNTGYYYNNNGYYAQNHEFSGGGSVSIIND